MKKLLLISAFVLVALWGSAQQLFYVSETTSSERSFTYGPKVALNVSNLSIKDVHGVVVENPMKVGFAVGAFANYRVNWFAIQGELLYSRQGTGIKFGDLKGALHLDYINIPILARFYLWDQFSVEIGPQVGFLVGKSFKDVAKTLDGAAKFHSADLSAVMGIAYDFNMGLTLDLRYNLGLVDAIKKIDNKEITSKNGVMQLSAAWNF